MNNYELLGKLITIHEECEDIFVDIGHEVDSFKSELTKNPEECDKFLTDNAILARIITDLGILKNLVIEYDNIVSFKFMELENDDKLLISSLSIIGFNFDEEHNEAIYEFNDKYSLVIKTDTKKIYGKLNGQAITAEDLMKEVETNYPQFYNKYVYILNSVCDIIIDFNHKKLVSQAKDELFLK